MKKLYRIQINIISIIVLSSLIFGCNHSKVEQEILAPIKPFKIDSFYLVESEINSNEWREFKVDSSLNFKKFSIQKGQLGEIKIGMTISEAEKNFTLKKEIDLATNFGFGGGSPAYLYSDDTEPMFALIPKLNTDTILFIIAIDDHLSLKNGLHPNSSVKEISEKYPNIKVNQDLMNGWEYISDENNKWQFIFKTENNKIGTYPKLEIPSDLMNKDIKANWIVIK